MMSYSLSLTGLLNMAVRQSAEGGVLPALYVIVTFFAVENQLVSVERVMEYTELSSEAPEISNR